MARPRPTIRGSSQEAPMSAPESPTLVNRKAIFASSEATRTSQALAAIRGRQFVQPDDVKRVAAPVLCHRLILRPESRLRKVTTQKVVDEVIAEIAVPTLEEEGRMA